ncbi:MAG: rod shape-determining protein MreD [Actinomycetota bacterium]|nr:rod shape-determining protein MreD [Actinomycetota bacterium]
MTGGTVARISAVVFVAAMLQAVIVSSLFIAGGAPDLLLVVAISLGLLRGSIAGAVSGFAGGLVVDLLTLDTLGVTSLVLTLAGFWAGRYVETTGRGRRLAPLVAVGVITVLAGIFGFVLHYMLGVHVVAEHALLTALAPALLLNLVLAMPVYTLIHASVHDPERLDRSQEIEVLV